MAVEKVSVNTPVVSGLSQQKVDEKPTSSPVKKTKDNSKMLAYALGGLAVASVAGILIYKAVKGKASDKDIKNFQLSDFAKKYADETIFADFAKEKEGVVTDFKPSQGIWSVMNIPKHYNCALFKSLEKNDEGKVSELVFAVPELNISVSNFVNNTTVFRYVMGDFCAISYKYNSRTGELIETGEKESKEILPYLYKNARDIVENLNIKKLLNDKEYREDYIEQLSDIFGKSGFEMHAAKTSKTVKEVQQEYDALASACHRIVPEHFVDVAADLKLFTNYITGKYNCTFTPEFTEIASEKGGMKLIHNEENGESTIELLGEVKDKFEPVAEKIKEILSYIVF